MRKKYNSEEADKRLRRTVTRNTIIMVVSLAAAIICYYCLK